MSESEEMYLLSIAMLHEAGVAGSVPLSQLAAALEVQSVSANQMVRKLEDAGWVSYQPYKGVELTEDGWRLAFQVLRRRRLWEVFLVERLHIPAFEAEKLACRLEHVLPDQAAERLAEFLGQPALSPQGKPIPATHEEWIITSGIPLAQLKAGQSGRILYIQADPAARSFLEGQGIQAEAQLSVLAASSDGDTLVKTRAGKSIHF